MKKCSKCKIEKDESEFNKNRNSVGPWCKTCLKLYHAKRNATEEQRSFRKKRNKKTRDELRQKLADYLKQHPCVICKETDIVVLEFDHLDPKQKEFCVADAVNRGMSWSRIEKEIEKCRVLCANCHRRHTAATRGWFKDGY